VRVMTSMLANDVQAKQAERDKLAADVAKWIAKHGQPVCHPPTVSGEERQAITSDERRKRARK